MTLRRKRIIGLRKLIATIVLAILVVGGVILYFPSTFLNQQATEKLTEYLVRQLGHEAIVSGVVLGWRSAVIRDIHLPLGKSGSRVEIDRIEFEVDALALFSQPDHFERVIRGVSFYEPRLILVSDTSDSTTLAVDSIQGDRTLRIPDEIFTVLTKLDSLHRLEIRNGSVHLSNHDSTTSVLSGLNGSILQKGQGTLSVFLGGHYLQAHGNRLTIEGEIQPALALMQLSAEVVLPSGPFAYHLHDSLSISTGGGELKANIWCVDHELHYHGSAALNAIEFRTAKLTMTIPLLQGDITEKGVDIVALDLSSDWFSGDLYGALEYEDQFTINARAYIQIDSLDKAADVFGIKATASGSLETALRIQGALSHPTFSLSARSDSLTIDGIYASGLSVSLRTDGEFVVFDSLSAKHQMGTIDLSGRVELDAPHALAMTGGIHLAKPPAIAGVQSDISQATVSINGNFNKPDIGIAVYDAEGSVRGTGSVDKADSTESKGWLFRFENPVTECSGQVVVGTDSNGVHASADGVHALLGIFFAKLDSSLEAVDEFSVYFNGNEQRGEVSLCLSIRPDVKEFLTQAVQKLEFQGRYAESDSASYDIEGSWSGVSGSADAFFGSSAIRLDEGRLTIGNFFIDEAGSISGYVDFPKKQVDLGLSIDKLPFGRFPVHPAFFDRVHLDGVLSGETRLQGPFDHFDWTSSLTLIDGTVFGVPGYWCNLDAAGNDLRAETISLSFGRGIQKILEAQGFVDLQADSIHIKAESGAADGNDFFLALTGINHLMTGELSGVITVTGKASSPEVVSELTILDGEMLGELYVDQFRFVVEIVHDEQGQRVLRVPTLAFGKPDTYQFSGELNASMTPGGAVSGHLEGSGDFLDFLDQVDGTFYNHGSVSRLAVEVGGTMQQPRIVSGILQVENGNFSYPSASPNALDLDILIHVAAPGVVDTGYIAFQDGDQFLTIRFIQDYAERYYNLKPLIIPGAGLDLGVLEFTTGADGIPVRLPGFMEPDWIGTFNCAGGDYSAITISAQDSTRLYISGGVTISDARITFPFVATGSGRVLPVTEWLLARLYEANWDLQLDVGTGNHYDVEITGFKDSELSTMLGNQPFIETLADYLDHLTVDAIIDPTEESLIIAETIEDSTFYLLGRLSSNRGRVDYLDQTFTVDYVYADFDETDVMPVLEGRAETYGVDSLGRSVPVYLTIYEIDRENNTRYRQGRFDDVTYVLESENASSPEAVLELLGYGSGNTTTKAGQVLAQTALSAAKRQWLDPIARQLERSTVFDEIALTPGGSGRSESLFRQQREQALADSLQQPGVVRFFTGSHVTVGKYITDDIFLTYTGELVEGPGELEGSRLGLVHIWNLELRMNPLARDLVLDFAVEYDEIERRRDESVAVKYSFTLEP